MWGRWGVFVKVGNKGHNVRYLLTDPTFLDVFTFPLVKGDPATALVDPFSLLLTERAASRLFGNQDPLGKPVEVVHRHFKGSYTVTGILKDPPRNSTLYFEMVSATPPPPDSRSTWEGWMFGSWFPVETYLVIPDSFDKKTLEAGLNDLLVQHLGEEIRDRRRLHVQPFNRKYLYSSVDFGIGGYGSIMNVTILATIAIFVLLIACANFMNLSTARSMVRAKEVGLRKVVGATRAQLAQQFLGEAILLSLLSLVISIGIVYLALPELSAFVGEDLSVDGIERLGVALAALGFTLVSGLLAGSYPALYLSSARLSTVLKGSEGPAARSAWFRRSLVAGQFAISIVLIIATMTITRQLSFVQNKELGFDHEQIVVLEIFGKNRDLSPRYRTIKRAFLSHPNVIRAAASHSSLGWAEGGMEPTRPEGFPGEVQMHHFPIDEDYLDAYGIGLLAGRNFSAERPTDASEGILLNATAVRTLGWDLEGAIGKEFGIHFQRGKIGRVIGVVEDFHIRSLHNEITSAYFFMWTNKWDYLSLKIRSGHIEETMGFLEETWEKFMPGHPFEFRFLDENLNEMYWRERRQSQLVGTFALVAIFVAVLGLFGLASFSVERRIQEIGIRKALGASVTQLVLVLSQESAKSVMAANLIAWPIAYYAMSQWLDGFAYRIGLGPYVFLTGGLIAFLIAFVPVVAQTTQAAQSNPVDALRHE